jgi:hypothetical protein
MVRVTLLSESHIRLESLAAVVVYSAVIFDVAVNWSDGRVMISDS